MVLASHYHHRWSPRSAKIARTFTIVSSTILLCSVVTFCIESLPEYRLKSVLVCPEVKSNATLQNATLLATTTTPAVWHTGCIYQYVSAILCSSAQ